MIHLHYQFISTRDDDLLLNLPFMLNLVASTYVVDLIRLLTIDGQKLLLRLSLKQPTFRIKGLYDNKSLSLFTFTFIKLL